MAARKDAEPTDQNPATLEQTSVATGMADGMRETMDQLDELVETLQL